MTFSNEARLELARVIPRKGCCAIAELLAMIRAESGPDNLNHAGEGIALTVGHPALARKVYSLFKVVEPQAVVRVERSRTSRRRRAYTVVVSEGAAAIAAALRERTGEDLNGAGVPAERCCRRAYLRGAFLCRGSVSAPAKDYHLEIVVESEAFADTLIACFEELGLSARMSRRKGAYLVYLKESEGIVDALSLMGAHHALLELENVRIVKEMRNRANRLVNCETANVDKTVNAAVAQMDAIRLIEERGGLEKLPKSLQALARARLEFPYASLRELGEMMTPKLSKSSVSYRMRRLMAMAEALDRQSSAAGAESAGFRRT